MLVLKARLYFLEVSHREVDCFDIVEQDMVLNKLDLFRPRRLEVLDVQLPPINLSHIHTVMLLQLKDRRVFVFVLNLNSVLVQ